MKEDCREKPRQEGDAREITAGTGILCAQSEKGRRVDLQYLAASSFHRVLSVGFRMQLLQEW